MECASGCNLTTSAQRSTATAMRNCDEGHFCGERVFCEVFPRVVRSERAATFSGARGSLSALPACRINKGLKRQGRYHHAYVSRLG